MGKSAGPVTRGQTDQVKANPVREADTRASIELITKRAEEDAEILVRLLKGADAPLITDDEPLSVGVALKAVAMVRLRSWRQTPGLAAFAEAFPTPEALERDMKLPAARQRVDGKQIAVDLLVAWHRSMSWSAIAGGSDVSVSNVQAQPVADELAQLLWQFRHLLHNTGKKE